MLGQILKVIRLLGLRRAVRMKKHHDVGLKYFRGYAATMCWWVLLNEGFLDEMAEASTLNWREAARARGWEERILSAVLEYLDGIGLVCVSGDNAQMAPEGAALFAEPRGLFELLWAYEPCFSSLGKMLTDEVRYRRDITRRVTYVGLGSGRLCEQLPYPVMRRMVHEHGCKMVLDLGCGDMAFLTGLCEQDAELTALGLDSDDKMVAYCQEKLAEQDHQGRLKVLLGDMFELRRPPTTDRPVDCITACDTFHEYLHQPQRLVALFEQLRGAFPRAMFVVGEFCLQDPTWLRKHKTASLEHHLFHELSNQQIGTAAQWRELFGQAGLTIVEEQVFDVIGHGYFALR